MRFFNTAGPIVPEKHYHVPIADRINIDKILELIGQNKYFILHAPRQSGKTTSLLTLMKILNDSGKYKCLYVNVESAQVTRENVVETNKAIIEMLERMEKIYLKESIFEKNSKKALEKSEFTALANILTYWSLESELPTILFIDEIDSLVGDSLISVLRQLRSGYTSRPCAFPQSLILCGIRDVKDYRIYSSKEKEVITGGSCFNVNAKSLSLGNFTRAEVEYLYNQHTKETGQKFSNEVIEYAWQLTNGQPWLANALAYEACFEITEGKNRENTITKEIISIAKENLIKARVTHLDQLVDKLKEERVRRVISPILEGASFHEIPQDDLQYVVDLGLVKVENGKAKISNLIYQEVIPRELTYITQISLAAYFEPQWYVNEDGSLDIIKLIESFQEFFRENSESWVERFQYKESGPQLLLQAFLQRIVNGGGRIFREYGLGRMRTDLLIEWKDNKKYVLELKILHKSLEHTRSQGISQTIEYMDKTATKIGHLLIFDRRENRSWDDKIFKEERIVEGKKVVIWGM